MKIEHFLVAGAITLSVALEAQQEAIALDPLDVEFSRTNLMLGDNKVLDPVHLSILERHMGFSEPINFDTYNANLRCKPLTGLRRATYSCAMSTFKAKGYEDLMRFKEKYIKKNTPDFLTEVREQSLERFQKLGIDVKFESITEPAHQGDIPNLAVYILLVKDNPKLSSVTLELSEKVSSKRTPEQIIIMPTFQIELFGENTETKGKVPMDIVKAVLDRFEFWWKFANKPESQ